MLILHSTREQIEKPIVSKTNHIAMSASRSKIHLTGKLTCSVTFQNRIFFAVFYLTDNCEIVKLSLIGLDWIEKLNLFEFPIKSVFNTFKLTTVSDIENHFTDKLK